MRAVALSIQGHAAFARLPARATLARWARAALAPDTDAELTLRFVGAREGRELNRAFRAQDHATNVLTFAYRGPPRVQADLVFCVPVLRREAKALGRPLPAHLAHLVVHGVLHAQGFDHGTEAQARRMEGRETAVLAGLGFDDPYRASTTESTSRSRK